MFSTFLSFNTGGDMHSSWNEAPLGLFSSVDNSFCPSRGKLSLILDPDEVLETPILIFFWPEFCWIIPKACLIFIWLSTYGILGIFGCCPCKSICLPITAFFILSILGINSAYGWGPYGRSSILFSSATIWLGLVTLSITSWFGLYVHT